MVHQISAELLKCSTDLSRVNPPLRFHRVSPRVYPRISPRAGGSNTGFILCEEGAVIVDTAATPAESRLDLGGIRHITDKPLVALVLTHHHSDHTFGATAFGCDTIATVETDREMRRPGQVCVEATRRHHEHLAPHLQEVELMLPTRTFAGQMTLKVTPPVTIIRMAGHTAGTAVVRVPEERVLFASDLVFNGIHPYTRGADLRKWIAALDEILAMDVRVHRGYAADQIAADVSLLGLPDLHRPKRLMGSGRAHWDRI